MFIIVEVNLRLNCFQSTKNVTVRELNYAEIRLCLLITVHRDKSLRTVVFLDAVDFTSQMRTNEPSTLNSLREDLGHLETEIIAKGGQINKRTGDGLIFTFPSSITAVQCCLEFQEGVKSSQLKYRIGIHAGEVTITENDLFGDAVNICSRLESLAEPGTIFTSKTIAEMVRAQQIPQPNFLGEKHLKGDAQPTAVYAWGEVTSFQQDTVAKKPNRFLLVFVASLIVLAIITVPILAKNRKQASTKSAREQVLKARMAPNNDAQSAYQPEGADAEALIDEAYNQIFEEMEAFEQAKADAIKSYNPKLVIDWLEQNPLGKRDKGTREMEHWLLIQMAIEKAKAEGATTPQEIKAKILSLNSPDLSIARRAFLEEFK